MADDDGQGLSLRDIVLETRKDVKVLTTKVDGLPNQAQFQDHETRIRGLESRTWKIMLAVVAISGGSSAVINQLIGG